MPWIKLYEVFKPVFRQLNAYMQWIATRHARVTEINVNSNLVFTTFDFDALVPWVPIVLPGVIRLNFFSGPLPLDPAYPTLCATARCLSCFPSLKELDLSWWKPVTNNLFIMQLRGMPIEVLNLEGCVSLIPDIGGVIASFGNGLRELRCDVLDDANMAKVTAACHCMQVLYIGCNHVNYDSVMQLCAANKGLKELVVTHKQEALETEEFVRDITKGCQQLQRLVLAYWSACSVAHCFKYVTEHCPHITDLAMFGCAQFKFTLNASRGRQVAMELSEGAGLSVGDLLNSCSISINSFNRSYLASEEELLLLGQKFGQQLKAIKLNMTNDKGDVALRQFFSCCPNIEMLLLGECYDMTDAVLVQIPILCPKVTSLSINHNSTVSEGAWSILIECFSRLHSEMDHLSFDNCSNFSDANLRKVGECFTNVKELRVHSTKVTKKGMLKLIKSHQLVVERLHCTENKWLSQQLNQAKFQPIPFIM